MNNVVSTVLALIYSGSLFFGAGVGLKTIHDEVKKQAFTKIKKRA